MDILSPIHTSEEAEGLALNFTGRSAHSGVPEEVIIHVDRLLRAASAYHITVRACLS